MRRNKPPFNFRNAILIVVVVTALLYFFADDAIAFLSGKDILSDLVSELEQRRVELTDAGPTPILPLDSPEDAQPAEAWSDGFPAEATRSVSIYTVQPGDALFLIADRFDLNANTIFWANTDTLQDNIHLLHIGTELYILPVDGVYHRSDGVKTIAEIAVEYSVAPGDILYSEYNQLSEETSSFIPPAGLRIVVPDGRREYISWQSPIFTGVRGGGANPEGNSHPGACRETYSGSGGLGQYINPIGGIPYRVTQGFEPWHPGVDMAADTDTPIYAAETGVVVFAGWHRDGYGELVIIDHGDGWTTYYGHLNRRYVDCGQQVTKGEYIGDMGSTGNSSGVHLHFEIRKDDAPMNPYTFFDIQDMRNA